MTKGCPSWTMDTQEYEVPRSMPIAISSAMARILPDRQRIQRLGVGECVERAQVEGAEVHRYRSFMSVAFALFTSNASLLPCELYRLDSRVALDGERGARMAGAGWYSQDDVLLRRFPLDAVPASPKGLGEEMSSEALVYLSAPADAAQPAESLAQPFRYRSWLFAHQGGVPEFARVRPALLDALPEFLR